MTADGPVLVDAAIVRRLYTQMLRIRRFEEAIADRVHSGAVRGPTHLCIGQEAVAVGVCDALRRDDLVFGGHRSHGHYLAKGGPMAELAAEIFGKATGCSRGRGGSMHVVATDVGVWGTSALVGGGMGIAVGAALAAQLSGLDRVSVVFFGDGAVEEGVFHEALNFAALKRLPVIFVCENNLYSSHMPLAARQPIGEIWRHAGPYGIPGLRIDGNDVAEVRHFALEAMRRGRGGGGPTLLECMTYRWRGHVGPGFDIDKGLRDESEVRLWVDRCPIEFLSRSAHNAGKLLDEDRSTIDYEVSVEVNAAMAFAEQSPFPAPSSLLEGVYR